MGLLLAMILMRSTFWQPQEILVFRVFASVSLAVTMSFSTPQEHLQSQYLPARSGFLSANLSTVRCPIVSPL